MCQHHHQYHYNHHHHHCHHHHHLTMLVGNKIMCCRVNEKETIFKEPNVTNHDNLLYLPATGTLV